MTGDPVYSRGDVLWRRTYDRVLLLLPETGELVTLMGSGGALWAVLDEPGSVGELAQRLAETYGSSAEQIAADIEPVVEELYRRGAVTVSRKGL